MHADPSTDYDHATQHIDPPLAIVDLDAFDANADALVARAAGKPVRVASKSVRCRTLLERTLARPGFAGLLCYSLAEALWLCDHGVSDDLLVAYPTVDAAALHRLAADGRARGRITIMVDSTAHLELIDRVLGSGHPEVRVCLELDASWRPIPGVHVGTRRSPLHTPRHAAEFARTVTARSGFRLVAMMAYEGQIAGVPDAGRGPQGMVVRWMQRHSAAELAQRREAAVRAVREVADLELVNGGGTGSVESTRDESAVTELAAGSGLIGSALFDGYTRFQPNPAVLFALPVARKPARGIATLFSGGYIASGPPAPSRVPTPHAPSGLRLLGPEGAGEVQTPVVGKAAKPLRPGDRVWLRHAKAGELAERFTTYHLVRGDRVVDTAPTYRGESQNFG